MRSEIEPTFDAIFEFTTIGMALITLEGKWQKINTSLCRMLGYQEHELLAIDIMNVFAKNQARQIDRTLENITAGGFSLFKRT